MRILVGVFSCWKYRHMQNDIREAWLSDLSPWADYRFFLGRPTDALVSDDEEALPVPDGYDGLSLKLRGMAAFAYLNGYDWLFKVDLDTFVNTSRLREAVPLGYDIAGCYTVRNRVAHEVKLVTDPAGRCDYPCGGAGTWYSRQLCAWLAQQPVLSYGGHSDEWAGHLAGMLPEVKAFHDPRYWYRGDHLENNRQIAVHLSKGTGNYDPAWMLQAKEKSK